MQTTIFLTLIGIFAGIFINYISDVLPHTRRFSQPICQSCGKALTWSRYLTLQPCPHCGKNRSLRMWLVLILTPASFVYLGWFPPKSLSLPLSLIVLTYFAVITVIDLEHRLILHPTSLFGAVLGLVTGTSIYLRQSEVFGAVGTSLLGGAIGFGLMFLLYKVGEWVARYRARKLQAAGQADDEEEALGGGDVYLAGVLGLMLGKLIILALLYGAALGGIVGLLLVVVMLIRRRYASEALMTFIPYGPYYILSAAYILFQPA